MKLQLKKHITEKLVYKKVIPVPLTIILHTSQKKPLRAVPEICDSEK